MLQKSQRVQRADFATFFKKGKRVEGQHATLVYTPFPTLHGSVVVSKKVSKRAVTRNTLRRRVYAQMYRLAQKNQTGVFIVVLKPSFAGLPRAEARAEIEALIVRTQKSA